MNKTDLKNEYLKDIWNNCFDLSNICFVSSMRENAEITEAELRKIVEIQEKLNQQIENLLNLDQ